MGFWSWLFPSAKDRLDRARSLAKRGQLEEARNILLHVKGPEAEKLFNQVSEALRQAEHVPGSRERNRQPESQDQVTLNGQTINLVKGPFTSVAPFIRVQLFGQQGSNAHMVNAVTEPLLTRPVVDGIKATVLLDFPGFSTTVPKTRLKTWAVKEDEVFRAGMANALGSLMTVSELPLSPGTSGFLLTGNGNYVASLALGMDLVARQLPRQPPHGYVLGVPNWHSLMYVPVMGKQTEQALPAMRELCAQLFQYQDAVSPDLIWWHANNFERVEGTTLPVL